MNCLFKWKNWLLQKEIKLAKVLKDAYDFTCLSCSSSPNFFGLDSLKVFFDSEKIFAHRGGTICIFLNRFLLPVIDFVVNTLLLVSQSCRNISIHTFICWVALILSLLIISHLRRSSVWHQDLWRSQDSHSAHCLCLNLGEVQIIALPQPINIFIFLLKHVSNGRSFFVICQRGQLINRLSWIAKILVFCPNPRRWASVYNLLRRCLALALGLFLLHAGCVGLFLSEANRARFRFLEDRLSVDYDLGWPILARVVSAQVAFVEHLDLLHRWSVVNRRVMNALYLNLWLVFISDFWLSSTRSWLRFVL